MNKFGISLIPELTKKNISMFQNQINKLIFINQSNLTKKIIKTIYCQI